MLEVREMKVIHHLQDDMEETMLLSLDNGETADAVVKPHLAKMNSINTDLTGDTRELATMIMTMGCSFLLMKTTTMRVIISLKILRSNERIFPFKTRIEQQWS